MHPYIFYPSHFWPHKNHRALITAYGIYADRYPHNSIDLVFYGSPKKMADDLKIAVKRMGLKNRIHFYSHVTPKKLARLWSGCECIIFPSLYEDSAPCEIIKALSLGKPILCSDLGIIRNIAKDAAIYFDSRKPEYIAKCIHTITSNTDVVAQLKKNGQSCFNHLQKSDQSHALELCAHVLTDNNKMSTSLIGIHEDGWAGGSFSLCFEKGDKHRIVELRLEAPIWLPFDKINMELINQKGKIDSHNIYRGNELTIRHALSGLSGFIDFLMHPLFRPLESNIKSNDERYLSLIIKDCFIVSNNQDRYRAPIKHIQQFLPSKRVGN